MILDYKFNRRRQELTISYITDNGGKKILTFQKDRWDSIVFDENGDRTNWDGRKCKVVKRLGSPGWLDVMYFLRSLPENIQAQLKKHNNAKLYTWDIETQFDPNEFPDPKYAKFPITCISCVNPNLDIVELGTKQLDPEEYVWIKNHIEEYLKNSDFYSSLDLEPTFKYLYFPTEEEMIKYFLINIVAKAPVLAGWNSDGFDTMYIQNRIQNYYPNLYMAMGSTTWSTTPKNFKDRRGDKYRLNKPDHTWMVDMMNIIENHDITFGSKENMTLDYIAKECIGIGKIEYGGDLEKLRQTDYKKYIYYSAIDSVLVQLIAKRRKIMETLYAQSLYCRTKMANALSKIALAECLFFNYFTDRGIDVVDEDIHNRDRDKLVGAYVRVPTPGKRKWVCCNDFASLYPSVIATCNIGPENFVGSLRRGDFTEEQLEKYRKDPNYFVSVNGSVYKNDKDYAFKNIQLNLKKDRGFAKYLSKQLDADVMMDINHKIGGKPVQNKSYNQNEIDKLKERGYEIKCSNDLDNYDLKKLKAELSVTISNLTSYEQCIKSIMNSCYGASSHQMFFWFNMDLANDITAEGQALIHEMEYHIPCFMQENWKKMKDMHKLLNIEVNG